MTKSRLTRGKIEVWVTWKGRENVDTSWMEVTEFRQLYPSF
jgi:hypothetical protein